MVSTRSQIRGGATNTPDNRGRNRSRQQEESSRRGTSTPAQFRFIPPRYYAAQENEGQESTDDNSSKEQRTHPLLATYEDKLDKLGKHPTFDDSIQEYMHWHYRLNHASFPTMLQMANKNIYHRASQQS